MNGYQELFLNSEFANNTFVSFLSLMFLFLGRFLPIIVFSPFFGSRTLAIPAKMGFALSLFAVFLPKLFEVTHTPLEFNLRLIGFFAKELLIGTILGYLISMPFIIVQTSGMVIDHQRGGASLMVNDPTVQNQSSPLGTLFNQVLIVTFYSVIGPFYFIEAIISSYDLVPPDKFLSAKFFMDGSPFWSEQLRLFNEIMRLGIQLATPALLIILMTDFFLGIANRLAPQVQMTFLGMPLKSLLALLLVTLSWKAYNVETTNVIYQWLELINRSIQWMRFGMDT